MGSPEGTAQSFRDAAQIPRWALPAVGRAAAAGLVGGSGGFFWAARHGNTG
ncbi:S-layer homology domain-containing protein [Thermodesulfitimonas sp.]